MFENENTPLRAFPLTPEKMGRRFLFIKVVLRTIVKEQIKIAIFHSNLL